MSENASNHTIIFDLFVLNANFHGKVGIVGMIWVAGSVFQNAKKHK